ncbi:hypothetical protein JMJ35_009757 [Cladonia borealis]|uniref:Uncharacterized protein n=1 Tax=Cladonia borealis TaxID=184061 RepID=A0AA39UXP7_9LECA|nr:hypothetical protein JMJ35_009757 [Cladonia borealis]
MQQPREEDPNPHPVSSVTLRFPTIPVHGTPENWLSQSQLITMNVNHEDSCDDTSSSLGDSSYEFIDERSNASTDYEDQDPMTESTTSSDGHGFDQVDAQPQQPPPSNHDNQSSQDLDSAIFGSQDISSEIEHFSSNQPTQEHESLEHIMTEPNQQQETIQFEEPSVINLNSSRFTEVSYTLQVLEKLERSNELYDALGGSFPGQLAVTVKQTMTTHGLTPKGGSYKILYVGPPENRDPIVQKIGTALAASLKCSTPDSGSSRPSKFNIVPISGFGEAAAPEVVLIDSSGLELTVEECHYAASTKPGDGSDTLHMEMTDGKAVHSMWNGSKLVLLGDWKVPDIAIFCVPEHDSTQSQMTRHFARTIMSRHAVQSVVISQTEQWYKSKEYITDYLTPHICLESRLSKPGLSQVIKRAPIDLATFLSIDAGQMNRNLACLAVAHGSSRPRLQQIGEMKSTNKANSIQSYICSFLDSYLSDSQREVLESLERFEPMAIFAVLLMSLFLLGLGVSGFLGASKVSNSRIFPTTAVATTTLASTIPPMSSFSTLAASTVQTTASQVSTIKSLSPNTDIASFLLDAYILAPNKSEQFKVHVLGDCHIVLRPPHWFSKLKKPPQLSFKVLRGTTELEHQLTTLFDGVHALQIPREDAYGLLNVSIWTGPKPNINEIFEVDFGSSWLKVAGWKKATHALRESVRDDLRSLQTTLSNVYGHAKIGLAVSLEQQRVKVKAQKETEKAIIQAHYKTAVRTKKLLVAKTGNFTRDFKAQIHERRAIISKTIRARAEQVSSDISLYTRNKTSMISQQTRLLARAATAVNVKEVAQGVLDVRRNQLRETQKAVLKMWWKLRGVPKHRSVKVKAKSRGGSSRRGVPVANEV